MKFQRFPYVVFLTLIFLFRPFTPPVSAALPQSWFSSTPTNKNLTAAMYGQGQLMVVGWGSVILKSTDGFNWQQALGGGVLGSGGNDHLHSAAYGNGMFVAGGELNMLRAISPDGVNWTNTGTIGPQVVYGLTFANGRFVGVGHGALNGTSYIITSTDGIDWMGAASNPTTNILRGVAFGNGLYVAVGDLGTIVTSGDGLNWTARTSGTANNLRAVTFTGTRFLAGGDAATMVTSTDGISWSPGAPPSFDVKGLASGNGAVVVVGNYQTDGRLHVSTDGLGWPGNPTMVSQPLNGVSYLNGRFVALGNNGLILQSDLSTLNGTNSWTKPTSGNWEEPYWSLGELPSMNHAAIMFTNEGFKALAINYGTTINYPGSLQIRNLLVDGATNSSNLLLLNYAGPDTPLRVSQDFLIGPRGALLSYNSALNASKLVVNGRATFAEGSAAQLNISYVGVGAPGELNISNALVSIGRLEAGGSNPGTVNHYAGSNLIDSMVLWGRGNYNLGGGLVSATNGVSIGLSVGGSDFAAAGGMLRVAGGLHIGGGAGTGRLLINGASVDSDIIAVGNGSLIQYSGLTSVGNMYVGRSGAGLCDATLSGGQFFSGLVSLGGDSFGLFWQDGGTHINTNGIILYGRTRLGSNTELGNYSLVGGRLDTSLIRAVGGRFNQSGGTNTAFQLSIEAVGRAVIEGGSLQVHNAFVGESIIPFQYSRITQSGGSHVIEDWLTIYDGGIYEFTSGSLSVSNIDIGASSQFRRGNVSFVNSGRFALDGGVFYAGAGSNQLGWLIVGGVQYSLIDLQTGGPSVLSFRDSRDQAWGSPQLVITNWAGSVAGGGGDRIYVGASSGGLTAAQLAKITFANPSGLALGNYPARILATGEIVPDSERPVLAYSRTPNGFQLSWDTANCQLLSSTNVVGPYQPISPQPASPYNVMFGEPQRFFELRCQ